VIDPSTPTKKKRARGDLNPRPFPEDKLLWVKSPSLLIPAGTTRLSYGPEAEGAQKSLYIFSALPAAREQAIEGLRLGEMELARNDEGVRRAAEVILPKLLH